MYFLILFSLSLISGCRAHPRPPCRSDSHPCTFSYFVLCPDFHAFNRHQRQPRRLLQHQDRYLLKKQIQANIIAALDANGDCKFPCWWGINPGQTIQEKAFALLEQIRFPPIQDTVGGWYYNFVLFSGADQHNSIDYEIHLQDKVVSYIFIRGQGYNNRSSFLRIWKSVSPEKVITNYGTPSRVWVELKTGGCEGNIPCATTPYELWLFYDEQGFLIQYTGSVDNKSTYIFCPTFNETGNLGGSIEIYLKSSQDPRPLESFTGYPPEILNNYKDIATVTGMSLDKFSAYIIQAIQPFCFSTPINIWPR